MIWALAIPVAFLAGFGVMVVPAMIRDHRHRRETLAAWDRFIQDLLSRCEIPHSFWKDHG